MKFCTECGTKAEFDGQKFCKVCGHKFPEVTVAPDVPQDPTTVILPGAKPDAPQDPTTIVLPGAESAAPLDDEATIHTPFRPAAMQNDAEPVQPAAPADEATLYTSSRTPAQEGEATMYVPVRHPVQPAAQEDDATMYVPIQPPVEPAVSGDNATARVFTQPQDGTAGDNVTMPADSFFVPPTDNIPPEEEFSAEPAPKKKKFPVVLIVVLVVVLVAALAVGGLFAWKTLSQSKNMTIGGTPYSIEDTTSLTVTDPSSEDWSNLCSLPNLTSLTVTGNGSAELNETKLNKLLGLQKLEELSVDGMLFPDGIGTLADMDALEKLSLTNCQLTSEQCKGLDGLRSLRELDLAHNALTDLSFLQGLTRLEKLDLSGNQITDYTPLTALTDLTDLGVDQCQPQALSALPSLKGLTVNGKTIEDAATYLSEQKSTLELYDSIVGWFESSDFSTLNVVLKQLADANSLTDDAAAYVDGWLMNDNSVWDTIRASLPADAKELVIDSKGLYYGQMHDGKRSGQGVQMFAGNYSVYSGAWENDLPNGTGTYRKTLANGTTLELSGTYANGYENGTMTFAVGGQNGTYTAANGTRTTIKQISDSQYAFVQFGTTYWYDASPEGHGVAIDKIAYQEEKSVQIQPEPQPTSTSNAAASSGSSKGSSSKGSSKGSSGSASTPAPSTPAPAASTPAPAASSTPTQSDSGSSSGLTDEEALRLFLGGLQLAKNIYDNF
ncbi:MAG: leucine-rich repeat domain-containing protein [Faecalibacterium prausnitzii]|nr:leucine-rich repeat domain-containing protein [Faecalibacterium prausnitzii]